MVVGALGRLLPNVGGSTASKRRVLCSVVHGILLYGAQAWIDGYRIQKYRQMHVSAGILCVSHDVREGTVRAGMGPSVRLAGGRKSS